jgi:hypothetical protein
MFLILAGIDEGRPQIRAFFQLPLPIRGASDKMPRADIRHDRNTARTL